MVRHRLRVVAKALRKRRGIALKQHHQSMAHHVIQTVRRDARKQLGVWEFYFRKCWYCLECKASWWVD